MNWYWVYAPAGKVKCGISEEGKSPERLVASITYLAAMGPVRRVQAETLRAGDHINAVI
jgi:hypothetical protein